MHKPTLPLTVANWMADNGHKVKSWHLEEDGYGEAHQGPYSIWCQLADGWFNPLHETKTIHAATAKDFLAEAKCLTQSAVAAHAYAIANGTLKEAFDALPTVYGSAPWPTHHDFRSRVNVEKFGSLTRDEVSDLARQYAVPERDPRKSIESEHEYLPAKGETIRRPAANIGETVTHRIFEAAAARVNEAATQKAKGVRRIAQAGRESAYARSLPGVSTDAACGVVVFPGDFRQVTKRGRDMWSGRPVTKYTPAAEYLRTLREGGTLFVRPCPVRPRHGFVDSRPVSSLAEFADVINATYKADPNAEVMVMSLLKAKWSAIATPSMVTLGPGNDGATSGRDSVAIPLVPSNKAARVMLQSLLGVNELTAFGVREAPYVEVVGAWDGAKEKVKTEVVQVRDGPAVPAMVNYVPHDIEVRKVIDCTGADLLEWETTAARLKGQAGVVVVHPGGNMASHYAVHCLLNDVAVITDGRTVNVGDTVKAEGVKAPESNRRERAKLGHYLSEALDPHKFWAMFPDLVGCAGDVNRSRASQLTALSIGAFHAAHIWQAQPHLLRLKAWAAVTLVRLMVSVGAGELRHYSRCCRDSVWRPMEWDAGPMITKAREVLGPDYRITRSAFDSRDFVYGGTLFGTADLMDKALIQMARDYYANWGQLSGGPAGSGSKCTDCRPVCCSCQRQNRAIDKYEQELMEDGQPDYGSQNDTFIPELDQYVCTSANGVGYGGPAWADAMVRALRLLRAIKTLVRSPSAENETAFIKAWNNATEAAHNGGALLNKYWSGYAYDHLPDWQGTGMLNDSAARIVLRGYRKAGE